MKKVKQNLKPIIFIFGSSGVGKSCLSELIEKQKFLFMHIDTGDKEKTFASNGFPSEWDNDFSKIEFDVFVDGLRKCLGSEHAGIIVSFPTAYRFTRDNLDVAMHLGVIPVLLWGSEENCKRAAETRINKKGGSFNLPRYDKNNKPTFQLYSRSEYDIFRLEAFRMDGSRFSNEELNEQIANHIRKFRN